MVRYLLPVSAAAVILAASSGARAQGVSSDQAAPDTAENSGGLEEIVVTAQKRAQNAQDVPVAITAATSAQLTAAGIVNTEDLRIAVPGLNIRTSASYFQPYIRGVGTSALNVENPVALYIDGVYYPWQREGMRDFNDIEQVAVLKGPQGTLFGRNATGGVIQITTKAPSHDLRGEFGVSFDNYGTLRGNAYISGGLSDTLAASLSVSNTTQQKGWGRNITTGKDTFKIKHIGSIRGKLLFQPDAETDITLIGDYLNRSDNLGPYYQPTPGTQFRAPGYVKVGSVYDTNVNFDANNLLESGGVSLNVQRDVGIGRLSSTSSYRKMVASYALDADGTPSSVFEVTSTNKGRSFAQELLLTSARGSRVNWAVGVYYFYNQIQTGPWTQALGGFLAPNPTSIVRRHIRGDERTNSIAPFGQLDFELLKDTRLTLGARWTYEKRKFDGAIFGYQGTGVFVPALIPPVVGASVTAKKPTWRIALDHQFGPDFLGYLSYNRGFKSGGFNVSNAANPPYQPEKLDAYEAGLKTELFDRHLRFNVAGFYYQYTNLQVNQFSGGTQAIVNGAKARIYGVDMDFEAQVADGLRFNGGVGILNAKFTDYPNATVGTPRPGGGVLLGSGNVSGNRLPLSQKLTASLGVDYTAQLPIGKLKVNLTESYNGRYALEPDNFTQQKAYNLLNAQVSWISRDDRLTIAAFVRNILNKHVIAQAAELSTGFATTYSNPPRVYGGSLRFSY